MAIALYWLLQVNKPLPTLSRKFSNPKYRSGLLLAVFFSSPLHAENVEILHWWTSPGEASAVQAAKQQLESQNLQWQDFAVMGGAGENAMSVLQQRINAGNPPLAATIGGIKIQAWGDKLANISQLATEQSWNKLLPPILNEMVQYKGQYVAVPLGISRVNTLWINKHLLDKSGAKVPKTWDEFIATAKLLQKAGITPLSVGQQGWQVATLFESLALGIGGADFYRKAFIELDAAALSSPTMLQALSMLKRLKAYSSPHSAAEWSSATAKLIHGQAAMQFMGDWAKSEFTVAGQVAGVDYLCVPAPSQNQAYSFAADTMTLFQLQSPSQQKAQQAFASTMMSKATQINFNLHKGNFPARNDVSLEKFDACAKESAQNFNLASSKNILVPSWSHNMAQYDATRSVFFDIIFSYWKNNNISPAKAAERLVLAAKTLEK